MYNEDMPTRAELPTSRQLIRSTPIALTAAIVILVTAVLPGEYGIDPTGIGRLLGLAEMGEIKVQLAEEAEADRQRDLENPVPVAPDQSSSLVGRIFASLLISPAQAQAAADEVSLTLDPGQGAEIKLVMTEGAKADFAWSVDGGVVNYDLHGDGGGNEISYQKDRAVEGHEGVLEAAFDGNHGWFWRNRGAGPVTVKLRVSGDYAEVKRLM
jgi:hypothetical protein